MDELKERQGENDGRERRMRNRKAIEIGKNNANVGISETSVYVRREMRIWLRKRKK